MAPASKKGTGKASARDRRSSSRHTTPISTLTDTTPGTPVAATPSNPTTALPRETPYLHTATANLISSDLDLKFFIEKSHPPSLKPHDPPTARELHTLHDKIRDNVLKSLEKRGETCERNLRVVVQKRKESSQAEREREAAEQHAADRIKKERDDGGGKSKKAGQKRSHAEAEGTEEKRQSVPSVGEHMVARQDGVGVHEGAAPPPSPPIEPGGMPTELMDTAPSPSDSSDSRDDQQPAMPLYKRAFGDDPMAVDDPTVYDIRPIIDGMTEEELRDIYSVAKWPESDLHDLTAGDPPDMDFSNAKPANQVSYSTFQTYLEPFIRPLTEEDVAFLKERGDRLTPYTIPQRGSRTYKEVWAAEDGLTGAEAPRKEEADPNVARGGMEDMNDEVAETDEVSMGPVMNRLLSILRPQPNASANNRSADDNTQDSQGDTTMTNADNADSQQADALSGAAAPEEHRPITALPSDAPRPTNLPPPDYDNFEARAIQELKYIGFLAPSDTPDFTSHLDDEVAARLRTLQAELRIVAARNNARKARILELTEERMAMQEYANIADDLDNQVNAAYLKRNRSLAKPSNKKGSSHQRPGQKGVAGATSSRGVSEGVKALMQKRKDWIEMVGPVVGFGRPGIPGDEETVFDDESMKRLERAEKEAEAGEGEGE